MNRRDLIREIGLSIAEYQSSVQALDETIAKLLQINLMDLRCLEIVTLHGPLTMGDVARASGLTPGAITSLIDRMEAMGYFKREHDLQDRRRVQVSVTDAWREQVERIWRPIIEDQAADFANYDDAQLTAVRDFLEHARQIREKSTLRLRRARVQNP